jgi:purine nucleosidase
MPDVLQGPGAPAPTGIVYNTSMTRPDAALALGALYAFGIRRQARVNAVCVTGAGLETAIYCDIVNRFYTPGPARSSNQWPPVGLAVVSPLPPDAPMVKPAVDRTEPNGEPTYVRGIRRVSDTSQAEAVLRNGVIFSVESAVVLSAPATWLARSLDLQGARDQYRQRVKRLVIVESPETGRDPAALRRLVSEWPSPIFYCGREVGEAFPFPGSAVDQAFGWTSAHPIADAYRAFKPMPYDTPTYDLVAMHYAAHPVSGFFQASQPGTLTVSEAGTMTFMPGSGGTVRRIDADASRHQVILEALVELVSTKPPPPPAPRGRGAQVTTREQDRGNT